MTKASARYPPIPWYRIPADSCQLSIGAFGINRRIERIFSYGDSVSGGCPGGFHGVTGIRRVDISASHKRFDEIAPTGQVTGTFIAYADHVDSDALSLQGRNIEILRDRARGCRNKLLFHGETLSAAVTWYPCHGSANLLETS
uniref:Uncharacterized protein n=1 Tax=Candidatus Kentrum sp. TC TaxID=2126339 RepID=A0A450YN59_9GAMM|nr:MAG: hypothetical protein BECKTC1821E_GA0114239_102220 [Candidatus Kentron sp. TC]